MAVQSMQTEQLRRYSPAEAAPCPADTAVPMADGPVGLAIGNAAEIAKSIVPGPDGKPLSLAMLPPPETRRWVVRRKAEVLAAINGGLLTAAEACARYRLSPEELELWQKAVDRAGVPGLRVTRIQLYRDDYGRRNARHAAHGRAGPAATSAGAVRAGLT